MRMLFVTLSAVTLSFGISPTQAVAQTSGTSVEFPAGYAPAQAPCVCQTDGTCLPVSAMNPLPIAPRQEAIQLVSANTAAAPMTVYGGVYTIMQGCTAYNAGSLTLRYRGPDGATMLPLVAKTASDSAGGTLVSLGANALVDVTLPSGSTGCNVTLARVP